MTALFSPELWFLWALALAAALYWPVRNLIWVLFVRRTEARQGRRTQPSERAGLKRRAGMTAALLCFVFAVLYVNHLFGPGR